MTGASHHNFSIGLYGDAVGNIVGKAGNIGDQFACSAKAPVQSAIGVVAHHGEFVEATDFGMARHHNLVVGLHGDASAVVFGPATDVGDHHEVVIQAAIDVVAHHCEIAVATDVDGARYHNLAIGLHGDALCLMAGPAESGSDQLACAVKGCIQGAIGVVTHNGKVSGATAVAVACHHNLAIGLHGDAVAHVVGRATDIGDHFASAWRGWRKGGRVVDRRDVDCGAAQRRQRDTRALVAAQGGAVAVAETPVDLHAGRWGI